MYSAYVKGFNSDIEEEVILEVNGVEIIGFMPFGIHFEPKRGIQYPISMSLVVLDDLDIQEVKDFEFGFYRIDESYSYKIKGILNCEKRLLTLDLS